MFKFLINDKESSIDFTNNILMVQNEKYKLSLDEIQKKTKIYFKFNSTCNISCSYCFQKYDEISKAITCIDDFREIILEKLKDDSFEAVIFGGEPLMVSNLHNIEKIFNWTNEQTFTFYTNCCHDVKTSEFIIHNKNRISKFIVTIDGPEKIHNSRRKMQGENAYKLIISNMHKYLANNINCVIAYNVDDENILYIEELYDNLMNEFGKNRFKIILNKTLHENSILNEKQLVEVYYKIIGTDPNKYSNLYINSIVINKLTNYMINEGISNFRCDAGTTCVYDFTNYMIYACPQNLDEEIGRIVDGSVNINNEKLSMVKNYISKNNSKCNNCTYKIVCCYGCIVSKDLERKNCKNEMREIIELILSRMDLLLP